MDRDKKKSSSEEAWSLGAEVRRRRIALGLTIEELAGRAGLSANFVGTIEIGKRDPSISTVLSLARGLNCAPREFFPGEENLSPFALETAVAFESAPKEIKDAVSSVLRFHQMH